MSKLPGSSFSSMLHNQKMIKSSKVPNKVTEAIRCRIRGVTMLNSLKRLPLHSFMSCNFMPSKLVRQFYVLLFHVLQF